MVLLVQRAAQRFVGLGVQADLEDLADVTAAEPPEATCGYSFTFRSRPYTSTLPSWLRLDLDAVE